MDRYLPLLSCFCLDYIINENNIPLQFFLNSKEYHLQYLLTNNAVNNHVILNKCCSLLQNTLNLIVNDILFLGNNCSNPSRPYSFPALQISTEFTY